MIKILKEKGNSKRYCKNLEGNKKVTFIKFDKSNSFYVFQILLKNRNKLIKKFKELGIGFSIQYLKPINKMSYYKKNINYQIKILNQQIYFLNK